VDTLHEGFQYIHVIGGFIGLFLYWVPILSKKGSPLHRKAGTYWVWLARLVLTTAFISVLLYLPKLLAAGETPFSHPDSYAFLMFLGYLSVVAYIVTMFAAEVLKHKVDVSRLAIPLMKSLAYLTRIFHRIAIFLTYHIDIKRKMIKHLS